MATTITPAVGTGAAFTQQGPGQSPGYSAIDLRRAGTLALQEGVYGADDFEVVERAAGANLSVDITMPAGGFALVQGDSVAGQGLYTVPVHSATVNESIAAADVSNPRVDSVILEVLDNVHDASGLNQARVRVLTGTPTSGATLDNRSGAPTLPGNALLLADVHVPASDTTIANSQIRDRRKWARGACFNVVFTSGTLLATSSTILAQLNSALSRRIELSGVDVEWEFSCTIVNTAAVGGDLGPWVEGAAYAAADGGGKRLYNPVAAGATGSATARHLLRSIAAGSHLLSVAGNSGSASGTVTFSGDTVRPAQFTVREVVRQGSANNATTTG